MSTPSTRRRLLRAVGAGGALALAGCLGGDPPTDPGATPPTTTTDTTTYSPTSGPDERVDQPPPGAPALPASGSWPGPRFDAGNTAYNPDGEGLREAEEYWRLRPSGVGAFADGGLVNVADRGEGTAVLARRDPGTAVVREATPLVDYGVNSTPATAPSSGPSSGAGPHSPAWVTLYVNDDATLRAYGAGGDQLWAHDTPQVQISDTVGSAIYGVTPVDGAVYVSARDALHGLGPRR